MKRKAFLIVAGTLALFALASQPAHSPVISLIRIPYGGIQPQAVVGNGTVHLLYFSGNPQAGDLFYVKSPDYGATWSAPLRVNSEPNTAIAIGTIRGGQMAIGRNGRIHVAWNGSSVLQSKGPRNPESGQTGPPMLYSRLGDSHQTFEPERSLMTRTFGLDGGGSLAAEGTCMWRGTGRVRVLRPERRVARFGWPSRGMTERPSPPKCRLGIMPQALAAAAGCPCSPTARELSVRCIARPPKMSIAICTYSLRWITG